MGFLAFVRDILKFLLPRGPVSRCSVRSGFGIRVGRTATQGTAGKGQDDGVGASWHGLFGLIWACFCISISVSFTCSEFSSDLVPFPTRYAVEDF